MLNKKDTLRRQISQNIAEPVRSIEEQIAASLLKRHEFHADLTAKDLSPILSKVLYVLVLEQKVAGVNVPTVHNVSAMDVKMSGQEARMDCEVQIHSPIKAFIRFQYTLRNHPDERGKLQLKSGQVVVKETTRPFDLAALAALRVMNVKKVALNELSDPNRLIQRTLPTQLVGYGFQGELCDVQLTFNATQTLSVHLRASKP